MLVALFRTFSISSISRTLCGCHTEFACSKCGLTKTLYNRITMLAVMSMNIRWCVTSHSGIASPDELLLLLAYFYCYLLHVALFLASLLSILLIFKMAVGSSLGCSGVNFHFGRYVHDLNVLRKCSFWSNQLREKDKKKVQGMASRKMSLLTNI